MTTTISNSEASDETIIYGSYTIYYTLSYFIPEAVLEYNPGMKTVTAKADMKKIMLYTNSRISLQDAVNLIRRYREENSQLIADRIRGQWTVTKII